MSFFRGVNWTGSKTDLLTGKGDIFGGVTVTFSGSNFLFNGLGVNVTFVWRRDGGVH
jgi:hypothetical protein